jgi:hypothetical protein
VNTSSTSMRRGASSTSSNSSRIIGELCTTDVTSLTPLQAFWTPILRLQIASRTVMAVMMAASGDCTHARTRASEVVGGPCMCHLDMKSRCVTCMWCSWLKAFH